MSAWRRGPWLGATIAALLLQACAPGMQVRPEAAPCRAFFDGLDARVARASVGEASTHRIPGFPYLRIDRVLASYAGEAADGPAFEDWLRRLLALDLSARRNELANLGDDQTPLSRVQTCARELALLELGAPAQRARLREVARVPDDYSVAARVFGLYPAIVPFLNLGVSKYHDEVRETFAKPVEALDSPGPLQLWSPRAPPPASAAPHTLLTDTHDAHGSPLRDALGLPLFGPQIWEQLAATYAPTFWIEQGGDYDRPGAVAFDERGEVYVDTRQPVVYWRGTLTRLGNTMLVGLVYTAWFSERPKDGYFDPYGGRLDGLMWRVTLDREGRPLTYDTIHSCGCYRYTFPAQALAARKRSGFWQEPVLLPQADIPAAPLAIRVQSGTHYVRRLVPRGDAKGTAQSYALEPYANLLSLPRGRSRRSLFGPDGLVRDSERMERWWLWPTGISSPGAMREWGRHATSFVGESHFDDARYLEQTFEVPDWAR